MEKVNLSAPWVTFVHELEALFGGDPDVSVKYDNEANHVQIFVDGPTKADALTQLLPTEKKFGNVTLTIAVVPANDSNDKIALMEKAFDNNSIFHSVINRKLGPDEMHYVMFSNRVAQFFNDQLDDPYGTKTMLYADIARDVFGSLDGVFYCTDTVYDYDEKPRFIAYNPKNGNNNLPF